LWEYKKRLKKKALCNYFMELKKEKKRQQIAAVYGGAI